MELCKWLYSTLWKSWDFQKWPHDWCLCACSSTLAPPSIYICIHGAKMECLGSIKIWVYYGRTSSPHSNGLVSLYLSEGSECSRYLPLYLPTLLCSSSSFQNIILMYFLIIFYFALHDSTPWLYIYFHECTLLRGQFFLTSLRHSSCTDTYGLTHWDLSSLHGRYADMISGPDPIYRLLLGF